MVPLPRAWDSEVRQVAITRALQALPPAARPHADHRRRAFAAAGLTPSLAEEIEADRRLGLLPPGSAAQPMVDAA